MSELYETIAKLMEGTRITKEEAETIGNGIKYPKLKHQWRLKATGIMDDFNLYMQVKSCDRPTVEFEEIQIPHTDPDGTEHMIYMVGKHQWLPLIITLEDDATGDAARVIQKQLVAQRSSFTADKFVDVKFDLKIEYLDSHGNITDTWDITGCWIQSADYTSLDYSASEVVEMELTIRYDHALMKETPPNFITD